MISLEKARALGKRMAHVYKRVSPHRFNCIRLNLQLAFPDADPEELESLAIQNLEETGAYFYETGYILLKGYDHVMKNAEVLGREHLDEAIASGKNILLLGAHYTCLDSCGSVMANQVAMDVVHRHQNSVVANYLILRHRLGLFDKVIYRDETSRLIRTLKDKKTQHILWLAPDQDFGHERSVFVPFLGVEKAATLSATSRLAKQCDLNVVFIEFAYREKTSTWVIEYHPIENYPTDDPVADAKTLNDVIGESVKRNPAQYYWVHRRFKSLEDGSIRKY